MGNIFPTKADVGIFYVLSVMLFAEFYAGMLQLDLFRKNRVWYEAISRRIIAMPPSWLFGVAWTVIYCFIWAAMFVFFRDNDYTTSPSYLIDTVTLLFVFNIMANKMWTYVFFQARQTLYAMLMILFIIVTDVVILAMFGANARWTEFGLFIAYPLWCCYALYLNVMWLYVETHVLQPAELETLKREPAPVVRANPNALPSVARNPSGPSSSNTESPMYNRHVLPNGMRQRANVVKSH